MYTDLTELMADNQILEYQDGTLIVRDKVTSNTKIEQLNSKELEDEEQCSE